jgi:hypothetical protein
MRSEAIRRALLALVAALAWLGCSSAALEHLRRHTYPPTFNYITEDQLKSTMWELASHTNQLDQLLRRSESVVPPPEPVVPPPEAGFPESPADVPESRDLVPPLPPGESLQQQVVLQLTEIDRVARALGPGNWPSNHPQVSRNIDEFRRDIEAARHAAELDPPNYLLAGSVTELCIHCHGAK